MRNESIDNVRDKNNNSPFVLCPTLRTFAGREPFASIHFWFGTTTIVIVSNRFLRWCYTIKLDHWSWRRVSLCTTLAIPHESLGTDTGILWWCVCSNASGIGGTIILGASTRINRTLKRSTTRFSIWSMRHGRAARMCRRSTRAGRLR